MGPSGHPAQGRGEPEKTAERPAGNRQRGNHKRKACPEGWPTRTPPKPQEPIGHPNLWVSRSAPGVLGPHFLIFLTTYSVQSSSCEGAARSDARRSSAGICILSLFGACRRDSASAKMLRSVGRWPTT